MIARMKLLLEVIRTFLEAFLARDLRRQIAIIIDIFNKSDGAMV